LLSSAESNHAHDAGVPLPSDDSEFEQRRIEPANRWLTESTQSLARVAIEVGFDNQSRLTSTFKPRTGFTPGEYRRERA